MRTCQPTPSQYLLPSLQADSSLSVLLEGSVGVCRVDPLSGKEIILYIVKPGEFFGNIGASGAEYRAVMIDVSLRQSDIACLIAASREITSLTLNELRRAGYIDFHDRRICVHDPASLGELSCPVE